MSRARIRTIKPELLEDERLGRCSRDARLLFVALITLADDEGRTRASGAYIRGQRYAYDDDLTAGTVENWLRELARIGVVRVYDTDRQRYAELTNWAKHQKVNRPSPSKIPAPSTGCEVFTEASLNTHGGLTEASVLIPPTDIPPTSDRHITDRGPPTTDHRPRTLADERGVGVVSCATEAPQTRARVAAIVEQWNTGVGDSGVRRMSPPSGRTKARDAHLARALKTFPEPESWLWCARALAASPHHRGANDRGWRADVDWLLERGNGAKLEQWMDLGARMQRGEVEPTTAPVRRLSIAEAQLAESAAVVESVRARARAAAQPALALQSGEETER